MHVNIPVEQLAALSERAHLGLSEARRRRKYCPPGPYTAVELAALQALEDIRRGVGELISEREGVRQRCGSP